MVCVLLDLSWAICPSSCWVLAVSILLKIITCLMVVNLLRFCRVCLWSYSLFEHWIVNSHSSWPPFLCRDLPLYSKLIPSFSSPKLFLPNPSARTEPRKINNSGHCLLRRKWNPFPCFHLVGGALLVPQISFNEHSSRFYVPQIFLSERNSFYLTVFLLSNQPYCYPTVYDLGSSPRRLVWKQKETSTDSLVCRRDQDFLLHISYSCAFLAISLTSPLKFHSFFSPFHSLFLIHSTYGFLRW